MSSTGVGTKGVPRAEREDQIVDAAIVEFATRGYARASMVDIAAAAGISKPLVYQYFGSKDGLFLECLHRVAGGLLGRLEDAEHDVDVSVVSCIHPLRAIFEALDPRREAWRVLFDTTVPTSGPILEAANEYRTRTTALAAAGSQHFLHARGLRDDADSSALTAVWMSLVTTLVHWWLEHPAESAASMTARCERLLAAILD